MTGKTRSGIAVAILAAVLLPSVGQAAGVYLGTSLVRAKVDADFSGGGFSSKRESHLGFHAGYRFGKRIAIEASIAKLVDRGGSLCGADACIPEAVTFDIGAERVELAVLGFLPLGRNVELFGKVGPGRVAAQFQVSPWEGSTLNLDSTDTVGIFGAGVAWSPARRLALRLQYDRHESSSSDGSAFWAGATFSLGR